MRRAARISVGLALIGPMIIGGCGSAPVVTPAAATDVQPAKEEHGSEPGETVALSPEALKIAGVRVETVRSRTVQGGLEVSGTVTIPDDAHAVVTPPVAGKVVRLLARIGDRVSRGQPLAVIQSGDLAEASAAIDAARTGVSEATTAIRERAAAVELARGRLISARTALARGRRLAETGAFSAPSLTAARDEASAARNEAAAARSDVAGARSRLARAERLSVEGLVARTDLDAARLDVEQAEIRLTRAEERTTLAEATLSREGRIDRQGLSNARELAGIEAEVRAAKLELDATAVALSGARSARLGAERTVRNAATRATALRGGTGGGGSSVTLVAPIAGVIVAREATLGQAVERATDLFDIENATVVWATANVPEAEIGRVRPGLGVTVTTPAYSGRSFTGTVQIVGTRLDPKTRTLPVQCRVDNPARLLRADLSARVQLATGTEVDALAVPLGALTGEADARAVFVADGDRFERRQVRVGANDGAYAEILDGLKPGDRIAVAGVFTLVSELQKDELKGDED